MHYGHELQSRHLHSRWSLDQSWEEPGTRWVWLMLPCGCWHNLPNVLESSSLTKKCMWSLPHFKLALDLMLNCVDGKWNDHGGYWSKIQRQWRSGWRDCQRLLCWRSTNIFHAIHQKCIVNWRLSWTQVSLLSHTLFIQILTHKDVIILLSLISVHISQCHDH